MQKTKPCLSSIGIDTAEICPDKKVANTHILNPAPPPLMVQKYDSAYGCCRAVGVRKAGTTRLMGAPFRSRHQ